LRVARRARGCNAGLGAALTQIGKGLATAEETDEHYTDAYLYRLRAEFLLKRDPPNPVLAEEAFQTAIATAKEQGARSYELLASLALAKLYQSTKRPDEAHAVLAPALEGFSPTPEMPEIAEAQALMERYHRALLLGCGRVLGLPTLGRHRLDPPLQRFGRRGGLGDAPFAATGMFAGAPPSLRPEKPASTAPATAATARSAAA
jgi:hypothetical protein